MFSYTENNNNHFFNLFQPQRSRDINQPRRNFNISNNNLNSRRENRNNPNIFNGVFENLDFQNNDNYPQNRQPNFFHNIFGRRNNDQNRENNQTNRNIESNQNFNIFENFLDPRINKNIDKKIKKHIICDNSKEKQFFLIAEKLRSNNKDKEALDYYENALKIKENSKYFHKKALSLIKLNQNELSKENIKKAISLNPNKSEFYQVLGYLQIKEKKIKEALDNFFTALNLNKNDINTKNYWNTKKIIYLMKKEKEEEKKSNFKNYLQKNNLYNKKFFKIEKENKEIPDYYNCCINLDLLNNPLMTPIGNSYEKEDLLEYLNSSKKIKDPISGVEFDDLKLCVENKVLKKITDKFVKNHPYAFDSFGPEDFRDIEIFIDFS